MTTNPASYWRQNKNWSHFIGKTGKIVFATKVKVTSPELESFLPYCFTIVEMNGERYEFMGEKGVALEKGDDVKFVLRKVSESSKASIINYGIKVCKTHVNSTKLASKRFFSSGKIILSGEHSVVYGEPALISAIDLGIEASVSGRGRGQKKSKYLKQIFKIFEKEFGGREIDKISISINSSLSQKSGLGSSAAFAHAVFLCLLDYFDIKLSKEEIFRLVLEAENYIHGTSSGVDPAAVVFGGVQVFKNNEERKAFERKQLKNNLKLEFILIDSGKALESTGDMVSLVRSNLESKKIIKQMGKVTREFIESIAEDEFDYSLISKNQRLLEDLGVVGEKAKKLVKEIEGLGGFAKITGAGGIKKGSGWLLVHHPDENKLANFIKENSLKSHKISIK
jgi:mevalonate kinase